MTTLPQWIAKAGEFDIQHIGGIPHFAQAIDEAAPPAYFQKKGF